MRIYLTHCSKEKSLKAKETGEEMTPDQLYTDPGIQQFMQQCMKLNVNWAILSDYFGIFLPEERHEYYEKKPDTVTKDEEHVILKEFERKMYVFDEIWFFIRPATFHPFYEKVLKNNSLSGRVKIFEDLNLIK
jgi:hypothetical protein